MEMLIEKTMSVSKQRLSQIVKISAMKALGKMRVRRIGLAKMYNIVTFGTIMEVAILKRKMAVHANMHMRKPQHANMLQNAIDKNACFPTPREMRIF